MLWLRPAFMIALTFFPSSCQNWVPTTLSRVAAVSSPSPRPISSPSPSPSPSPSRGGGIVIVVPTPAPVLCIPAPVVLAVAQRTVISCAAQGYSGPFSWKVSDSTIAAVQLAEGTFTLFYVAGLRTGTTTLSLQSPSGGIGQVVITVVP